MSEKLKPFLACDIDLETIAFPLLGLAKIDGVRAMHIQSDHNPDGKFTGRSLKEFKNPFVASKFNHLAFSGFDGELTLGDITAPRLCSHTTGFVNRKIARPGKPTESDDLWWNVFDYLAPHVIHSQYIERLYQAERRISEFSPSSNIRIVPHTHITNMEELLAFDALCISQGYEGSIFRDPYGMYKSGRCSNKVTKKNKGNTYLRLKQFVDFEVEVVNLIEAMENTNEKKTNELGRSERSSHQENMVPKGMVGMIKGRVLADVEYLGKICMVKDQIIDIGPGEMNHNDREGYWRAFVEGHTVNGYDNIVGQIGTVKFFPHGQKDKPRFPTWKNLRSEEDMS